MSNKNTIIILKEIIVISFLLILSSPPLFAETVSGGGYVVQQIIAPIQGALSGGGYVLQQNAQTNGGVASGGGYTVYGAFGTGTSIVIPSVVTPPSSGGGSNGGGFYILPAWFTGAGTTTASSTIPNTILTGNGSTCSTRITFSAPIDVGLSTNVKSDVKKLEIFLNTYENEKLPVNGVYEPRDVAAVKRWQLKYRTFILDPMRLKQPTGTIYTLSQRQIERQTTRYCGEPIVVTACPFFKQNVSYGDRGTEVKKAQQFLNIVQGEKLPLSGVFGPLTREAVKRFQRVHKIYVATFIPFSFATGNWYTTTRIKANETIGCDILR